MTDSRQKRIYVLKELVREYYVLPYGVLIERPHELVRVFDIRGGAHDAHPHKSHRVYMSRRAVKHFVERRKYQLGIKHTDEEVMENIFFAIDKLQETITQYDIHEANLLGRFEYAKDYSHVDKPMLRIILEKVDGHLEIVTIHFRKK